MQAIIIISVNAFLQFVYAFVLAKLDNNFKRFMPKSCLTNNKPDVLFIVSLIIWGAQTSERSIQLIYNFLISRRSLMEVVNLRGYTYCAFMS